MKNSLVIDALTVTTQKQKDLKFRTSIKKKNKMYASAAIHQPMCTFRQTQLSKSYARQTVQQLYAEALSVENTKIQESKDQIIVQKNTSLLEKFKPSYFYYNQLNQEERVLYLQIENHIFNDEAFLINVVDQNISGQKLAQAYNMDYIMDFKGLVLFKTGQLKVKYYNKDLYSSYHLNQQAQVVYGNLLNIMNRFIESIDKFNCVNQLVQYIVQQIDYSELKDDCSAFHALIGRKANSLGIARVFSLLLRQFDIESHVVAGTFLGKLHYWNIINYKKEYIQGNLLSLIDSPFHAQNDDLFTFIDITSTILNKIDMHIPYYHINVDFERINADHSFLNFFIYPETQNLVFLEEAITNHQKLRDLMKKISLNLSKLSIHNDKLYYDVLIIFGQKFTDTQLWLESRWSDIISMLLRYAPNFQLKSLEFPRTPTPAFTFVFSRQEKQDFILYPQIFSTFQNHQLDELINFVITQHQFMNKLIIPLDTDKDMNYCIQNFQEDYILQMLRLKIFDTENPLDSCIFGYNSSAMLIVIIFIHIPEYNNVPKYARKNRLLLQPSLRYIYSTIVQNLMKRIDEITILYTKIITQDQLTFIFQCIRLDYPELFFTPIIDIIMSYDQLKREMKILVPLPDFTQLQHQSNQLNQMLLQLPQIPKNSSDYQKQEIILQYLINNYYAYIQLNQNSTSAYDFLIEKQVSSQSISTAFALLCQSYQIPACAVKSEKSKHCITLNWIASKCTILDLYVQFQGRIEQQNQYFYPTFSFNISYLYYKLIDNTFQDIIIKQANSTLNPIFKKYKIENLDDSGLLQLKQSFSEQIVPFQRSPIVQICHTNIKQSLFFDFLYSKITSISAHLLMNHQKIHPINFKFDLSSKLPVVLVRLKYEINFSEVDFHPDNLEVENQKNIAKQIYQHISLNKEFSILKLSYKTLPNLYQQQFSRYKFDQNMRILLKKKIQEHVGQIFYIIPCFNEYCIIFIFAQQ
ncbi:hypothetical protein SS50377_20107 [Spironucleus salmonicida]|uniref:Transglutaminase-like superfamily protein n=1 Tax=Spironucleus salmonicida TaxID=348837 RepID=V6LWK6_9EUKA|nr:hypothetical protein SS50377_20107 [Spironucleus salmonicida]|eukprot:EST45164.1 hypothetical protein SS50377_14736 [Spironucleus salmonicida]